MVLDQLRSDSGKKILDYSLGRLFIHPCVPVSQLKAALSLPDDDFSSRFGFQKPSANTDVPIVVSCLKGGRAEMANVAFQDLGFNNIRVYRGSFLDWVAKGGPVEQ